MILFDPEQSEAVAGFPGLVAAGAKVPAQATLARALREAQGAVGLKGEVTVLLTTDAGIKALNRRFRKKNKATDVLSFPADPAFAKVTGVAGDLAISVETAARQAAEQGHRLSVELRVLMLHGLLHLAGMDHEADAGQMARKEARLREKLRLPLGLIERVKHGEQRTENREQKSTSRFPSGMTERKATATEQQIPLRGMTERKARATATAREEADSPKGNDRKKSKGNRRDKGEADSLTGMTDKKARTKTKTKSKAKAKINTKAKPLVDFGTAASTQRGAR